MIILGIDPGDPAGWAKYVDGEYERSGLVHDVNPFTARDIIRAMAPDILVVEDQHPGKCGWKSMRTLMRRRFIWEVVAELEGIRVEVVHPATWQAFFRLRKGKNAPPMVEQYSALAAALIGVDVCEVYGDRAAGTMIAYWGALNL